VAVVEKRGGHCGEVFHKFLPDQRKIPPDDFVITVGIPPCCSLTPAKPFLSCIAYGT